MLSKIIRLVRVICKVINVLFYKLVFGKKININPLRSYFSGVINIDNGNVLISDGCRNKRNLLIEVNNGGILEIGKNVFFNNNVSINCKKQVIIGRDCLFGENITIYDHNHKYDTKCELIKNQGFDTNKVIIGSNVWIGSNSIILSGVTISDNVVIAAGSVVTKNIASNSLFVQKRNSFNSEIL
ncbi:acyltransferase [Vibrio breoganii]